MNDHIMLSGVMPGDSAFLREVLDCLTDGFGPITLNVHAFTGRPGYSLNLETFVHFPFAKKQLVLRSDGDYCNVSILTFHMFCDFSTSLFSRAFY